MNRQRPSFANMIVPLVLDSLSNSAPQRSAGVKSYQEAPPDPTAEAAKLICLGLACIAIGVALLNGSRLPPPR